MSLINDALKRASQAEKGRARDPDSHSAMQPASEPRRTALPALAGAGVVILLAAAAALGWHYFSQRGSPESTAAPAKQAAPVVVTPPPPKIEPASVPAPAPPPPPSTTMSPAVVAVAVTPPPAPPAFPALKLQSIFFNRNNPKAAINGQIHGQNELMGDVRILTITPDRVTVEWNGQTKDLILEGN